MEVLYAIMRSRPNRFHIPNIAAEKLFATQVYGPSLTTHAGPKFTASTFPQHRTKMFITEYLNFNNAISF